MYKFPTRCHCSINAFLHSMYSISTKYSFQPPLTAGSGQFGFTLAWANAPESPWYCSWSTSCAGEGIWWSSILNTGGHLRRSFPHSKSHMLTACVFDWWCKRFMLILIHPTKASGCQSCGFTKSANRRYQQTTYGCSQCVNDSRRRPHC